uniref:Uncharacterized protein n=1 Tax=Spongospora subterranea TaxID=70186 RepID=A0A0H5QH80_9EUKA|eukprot:CRZ00696.1 hypothetical protein [Spongospora subterranea]
MSETASLRRRQEAILRQRRYQVRKSTQLQEDQALLSTLQDDLKQIPELKMSLYASKGDYKRLQFQYKQLEKEFKLLQYNRFRKRKTTARENPSQAQLRN